MKGRKVNNLKRMVERFDFYELFDVVERKSLVLRGNGKRIVKVFISSFIDEYGEWVYDTPVSDVLKELKDWIANEYENFMYWDEGVDSVRIEIDGERLRADISGRDFAEWLNKKYNLKYLLVQEMEKRGWG